jgi:hypothetical protein
LHSHVVVLLLLLLLLLFLLSISIALIGVAAAAVAGPADPDPAVAKYNPGNYRVFPDHLFSHHLVRCVCGRTGPDRHNFTQGVFFFAEMLSLLCACLSACLPAFNTGILLPGPPNQPGDIAVHYAPTHQVCRALEFVQ